MDKVVLIEWIPSFMSAVAGIAAAVAAFYSLKVSKDTRDIAEKSALAVQHNTASNVLFDSIEQLKEATKKFSEFSDELVNQWASEIGAVDQISKGGENPRPLRHVLSNASEMLATHAIKSQKSYRHVHRTMYAIIRDGLTNLNEDEYNSLLKKGDHTYPDFEQTFGKPSIKKPITESKAFRWAFYQLSRRVPKSEWKSFWEEAWQEGGWLYLYEQQYIKLKPVLIQINKALKSEKEKLGHSVFPLESNSLLFSKYERLVSITDSLIEECNLDSIKPYVDTSFDPDFIELILYSMATAYLGVTKIDYLYGYDFNHPSLE